MQKWPFACSIRVSTSTLTTERLKGRYCKVSTTFVPPISVGGALVVLLALSALRTVPEAPTRSASQPVSAGDWRQKPRPKNVREFGTIDVNKADEDALRSLPGIGPALASNIVEAREQAPFKAPEDLLKVRGIGRSRLAKLRKWLKFSKELEEPRGPQGGAKIDRVEVRQLEGQPIGPNIDADDPMTVDEVVDP